jgi:phosphosulfolactate synthase
MCIRDSECGAAYVIVEGRETGKNAGIYDKEGDLDEGFLNEINARIPHHLLPRLIWEAPLKKQQVCLIESFGRNVNIGNIPGTEVYSLECLRRGLRSDTFSIQS